MISLDDSFRNGIFRLEGEYWTIVYQGTLFRLRDAKGLRYLAHLLRHPGERIASGDLLAVADASRRNLGPSAERTRVAVTKRIKATIAKIATLHPALADHLISRIRTGHFCLYGCDSNKLPLWKS